MITTPLPLGAEAPVMTFCGVPFVLYKISLLHACACKLNDCCVTCSFKGVDIALFSAGGSISKKLGPVASDAGCTVSISLHW